MTQPLPTFYFATCGGISGVLFSRRGRRLFLPTACGPLHVIQLDDVVVVLGEMAASMAPYVVQEIATREREHGEVV